MRKRASRVMGVESLEKREVFSATVVEAEPNDRERTATAFVAPDDGLVVLTGESTSRADKDFFVFTAPASGPAQASVQGLDGRRVQLEWTNAAGVTLLETEPKNGLNDGTVELEAGQRYFLRLRSIERSGAAAYRGEIQLTPGGPGELAPAALAIPTPEAVLLESEPNNRKSQADAFSLEAGDSLRLAGQTTKRDNDYFTYTPQADGQLRIQVSSPVGDRIRFQIEDQFGNKVFETEPNDGVHGGAVQLQAGVKYFLGVRGDRTAASDYHVDLALTQMFSV